jgi:hypothetical protein
LQRAHREGLAGATMMGGGMVTLENVHVIHYRGGEPPRA